MTTGTQTASDIFADARFMHSEALRLLEAGDIRDAAEKAWCATRRATEALILVATGERCVNTTGISTQIRSLGRGSELARSLQDRYGATARFLHGDCFYNGSCEPVEDTERRVRETDRYIADAERLAFD